MCEREKTLADEEYGTPAWLPFAEDILFLQWAERELLKACNVVDVVCLEFRFEVAKKAPWYHPDRFIDEVPPWREENPDCTPPPHMEFMRLDDPENSLWQSWQRYLRENSG